MTDQSRGPLLVPFLNCAYPRMPNAESRARTTCAPICQLPIRSHEAVFRVRPCLDGQAGAGRIPLSATRGHRAVRRSEEHTSELQSLMRISYAVFCLKKKNN